MPIAGIYICVYVDCFQSAVHTFVCFVYASPLQHLEELRQKLAAPRLDREQIPNYNIVHDAPQQVGCTDCGVFCNTFAALKV